MEDAPETHFSTIYVFCLSKVDMPRRFWHASKRKLGDWFSRSSSVPDSSATELQNCPPASSQALDLEASRSTGAIEGDDDDPEPETLAASDLNPPYNFDWTVMVIGSCLTSGVEIALQSLQPQIKLPLLVHLLSLAMVFAFCSFFVSSFISRQHFPRFASAMVHVGKLSVFVAFFLAITVPFSFSFKLIAWSVFVLSLLIFVYAVATRILLGHA